MFVQTLETWMDISVMYNEKIKKSHFRQADLNSTNIPVSGGPLTSLWWSAHWPRSSMPLSPPRHHCRKGP